MDGYSKMENDCVTVRDFCWEERMGERERERMRMRMGEMDEENGWDGKTRQFFPFACPDDESESAQTALFPSVTWTM